MKKISPKLKFNPIKIEEDFIPTKIDFDSFTYVESEVIHELDIYKKKNKKNLGKPLF